MLNEKLFRVFHPAPLEDKVSSWFCKFHPTNLLTQSWNKAGNPVKAICEQCMNLFIYAGRREAREHPSNSRPVRRRNWS